VLGTISAIPSTDILFGQVRIPFIGVGGITGGTVFLSAGLGGFTFPGGSYEPGELPTNEILGIQAIVTRPDSSTFTVMTIDFDAPGLTVGGIGSTATGLFAGDDALGGGNVGDTIFGFGGNDAISGNGGWDRLFGNAGNDTLMGGRGNDQLRGGDQRDILNGGAGRDVLTGGRGADSFDFSRDGVFGDPQGGVGTSRRDVVTDFTRGVDKLVIDDYAETLVFRGWQRFDDDFQVRAIRTGEGVLVQVNLTGTLAPEFEVLLAGVTVRLGTSDVVL
jgi:Ca2+-binding RTX toxin-like protein